MIAFISVQSVCGQGNGRYPTAKICEKKVRWMDELAYGVKVRIGVKMVPEKQILTKKQVELGEKQPITMRRK